jgi:hypothetical protein
MSVVTIQPDPRTADREAIRSQHKVTSVRKEEEGIPWGRVTSSSWGWTVTPAGDNGGVFQKPIFRAWELHKLADGSLHIIGFADSANALKISSQGAEDVILFPDPEGDATQLVVLPHSRIASFKPLDRTNANSLRASLKRA